ncbi:MAG: tetratricopeptide repeat protein, partial [Acidimicrobiia bacterium]
PPPRTLEAIPNNLPVQFTSFVGREDDVATALEMLESSQLLTLLGPGGTGKTRLSVQVAAEAADRFKDGVYFVPLASVTDPDLIAPTILSTLGVAPASAAVPPSDQLIRFLSDKAMLLVLDNFEQLVEGAGLVGDLCAASVHSRILVSSRVPLRLRGEQELAIAPLQVASPESDIDVLIKNESVHLFVERAQAVQPGFALTEDNARAVVELVRRLDGLPLAIELAVSKLKLLSVEALLERLEARSLTGGPRDAPERHQTMWNAIAWSEEALSEPCRRLFARLSVFLGGARLEEIERVCGPELGLDVLEGLATLVDTSLVLADRANGRFRMLQVIREYAAERLDESGEAGEVGRRHTLAYLDLIETAAPELIRRDRKMWAEALDADHDNLRSATARCVAAGDADGAFRFAWSMWRYWQIRGHLHEARRRVDEILAMPGGEPRRRAKAIEALGGIAWWQGDADACTASYDEALRLQRGLGDDREIANALYNAGLMEAFFRRETDRALEMLEEAMAIYTRLGDEGGLADVHWGRGNMALITADDPREGIPDMERCIELYRAVGNVFGEGWGRYELGEAYRRSGDAAASRSHYIRGIELLYGTGEISAAVFFLLAFAGLSRLEGDDHRGAVLAGAAWALGERSGVDLVSIDAARIEGVEKETLEAFTGDLADAYRVGRAMTPDEAVAFALGTG